MGERLFVTETCDADRQVFDNRACRLSMDVIAVGKGVL